MAQLGTTERTNELLGGQYFNPTTGAQEQSFVPVITPEKLQPNTPVPPAPKITDEDLSYIPESTANSLASDMASEGQATSTSRDLLSKITGLMGQTSGKASYEAEQLQASGADALAKRQREINAQISGINNEVQATKLNLEKQAGQVGASTTALNKALSRTSRDAAIRTLTLKSEYDVNAGNLETAKETAKRAVDIKYGDIESQIDQNTKLLDLYAPFMTQEQTERANTLKEANDLKKTALADKKKSQQDLINFAQQQGDTATASAALRLDPNSSTFVEDLANLQGNISVKKGSEDVPMSYREWVLAGQPGTFADWVKGDSGLVKQDEEFKNRAKDLADDVWGGTINREVARTRLKQEFPNYDENAIYDLVPDNYQKLQQKK